MSDDPRLYPLLERLVLNARFARTDEFLLNPEWRMVPTEIIELIEDIVKERRASEGGVSRD